MKFKRWLFALILIGALSGCGQPVPESKSAYVGEWRNKTMYILIAQDGSVSYKRLKAGVTTSVEGPLKGFVGDNFEVGIGFMTTTFVVNKVPYEDNGKWRMVVDGVELVKSGE